MTRIQHPEFRDENQYSRYPFADSATFITAGGLEFLPETFIDASLYPIGGGPRLYISSVEIAADGEVTLIIGDDNTATLAFAAFDVLDPPAELQVVDFFGRPAGIIVSDPIRLALFQTWPVGNNAFTIGATEFAASTTIPTPEIGVRGFLTEGGDFLAADVWWVGDDGVLVREEDGNIRIDILGDPLYLRRLCRPNNLFETPLFIQTINGCTPDENGNFNLTPGENLAEDTVLRVVPEPSGTLRIEAVGQQMGNRGG